MFSKPRLGFSELSAEIVSQYTRVIFSRAFLLCQQRMQPFSANTWAGLFFPPVCTKVCMPECMDFHGCSLQGREQLISHFSKHQSKPDQA